MGIANTGLSGLGGLVASQSSGTTDVAAVYASKFQLILSPNFIFYPGYTGPLYDGERGNDAVVEEVSAGEDIGAFAGANDVLAQRVYDQTPNARHHTFYGGKPRAYIAGVKQAWGALQYLDYDANRGLQNTTALNSGTTVFAVVNHARLNNYHQVIDSIGQRCGGLFENGVNKFHNNVYPASYRVNGVAAANVSDNFPAFFATNIPCILSFVFNNPQLQTGTLIGNYTFGGGNGGAERQATTMISDTLTESEYLLVLNDLATKYGVTLP